MAFQVDDPRGGADMGTSQGDPAVSIEENYQEAGNANTRSPTYRQPRASTSNWTERRRDLGRGGIPEGGPARGGVEPSPGVGDSAATVITHTHKTPSQPPVHV